MNDKKLFPRHAAGMMELKEGTGPITAMCPCGKFLEMYKADKTFYIQSPEGVDPDQTNQNAPWVTTPTDDVGSKNPIVSRILLQGYEILKAACFQREVNKEVVTVLLHTCKEQLLACEKIAKKVQAQIDEIIARINNDGIPTDNHGRALNSFPQVTDLTTECSTFLTYANRTIKTICHLPAEFIVLPSSDSNFEKLAIALSSALGADAPLSNFVNLNAGHIKHIIELRNFHEHPKEKKTVIENFRCTPHRDATVPQWYVSGDDARPIKEEMTRIVNYLLEVAEAMVIYLVIATVRKEIPYVMEKIEESKINPDVPIKYRLTIDASKLKMAK